MRSSTRTPVVETYLQEFDRRSATRPRAQGGSLLLGRMDMGESVDRKDYLKEQDRSMESRLMGGFNKLFKVQYQPLGFSWMVYADRTDFDRSHYEFHYIRREFLGDIRCLVFDVTAQKRCRQGTIPGPRLGRGSGLQHRSPEWHLRSAPKNSFFFHMDSWRLNLIPGYWVPAYIYSEEGDFSAGAKNKPRLQGADPHLGLRPEERRQGRRTHPDSRGQREG
jgi:hypothetical protein